MKFCINCMAKIRDTKDICPFCGQMQNEGVKSSFHLSPGITLNGGRYLVGKAIRWDSFSVTYIGRDLLDKKVVDIQEYVPETIVRRQVDNPAMKCISREVLGEYEKGLKNYVESANLMKEQAALLVNVATVYDCFYENGTGYIVGEHLNGQTIQELLDAGHIFPWDSAKQIIDAVLDGVIALNQVGVFHQDIYPGCILITAEGGIKVTSPGGYRYHLIGSKIQRSEVVRSGYSAQEQFQDRGKIGAYTDVYGVGALMYHMVTGRRPQPAAERIHEDKLQIPKEMQNQIPQNIQNALMNSLQLLPQNRTQTPQKFQKELSEKKVERIVVKAPQNADVRAAKKKTKWIALAAAAAVCVLGGVAAFTILGGRPAKDADGNYLVPNLVGISEEKAASKAKKSGMQIEVIDVLPSEVDSGEVIGQSPEAGEKPGKSEDGKKNVVQVTISGGDAEVTLPYLVGKSQSEAKESLKGRKLQDTFKGIYTTGEDSQTYPEGTVVAQLLDGKPFTETKVVPQKSQVEVQYSLGDYSIVPELAVPNFLVSGASGYNTMTVDEANAVLEALGELTFALNAEQEEYNYQYPAGTIISQDVEAGTVMKSRKQTGETEEIAVVVSKGPETVTVPDVAGMSRNEARAALEAEGLWLDVTENGQYSSSVSSGKAISTWPAAGESIEQGAAITLSYSIGPKPAPQPSYTPPSGGGTTPAPTPTPAPQPSGGDVGF